MSILDIFSSSKKITDTASDLIGAGAKGIDVLFYTEQEKDESRKTFFQMWIEFQRVMNEESTPRAIARRILAFIIIGVFLSLLIFGIVIWKFDKEWSKVVFDGLSRMEFMTAAVITTYFVTYGIGNIFRAKK